MKHEIKVPEPGESITEVFIGTWQKKSGETVKKDEVLVDLETEKTSFEIHAEVGGKLEILFPDAETKVKPGDVIATIDDSETAGEGDEPAGEESETKTSKDGEDQVKAQKEEQQEENIKAGAETDEKSSDKKPASSAEPKKKKTDESVSSKKPHTQGSSTSPAAKKLAEEKGILVESLLGPVQGGRITKDANNDQDQAPRAPDPSAKSSTSSPKPESTDSAVFEYAVDESRGERRERASRIRRTIAANLVAAQKNAAILTTFNEVDMSEVMEFRKKHNEAFKEKHGVKLGMVSFFARAAIRALKLSPQVNATFTGEDIIYRDFVDLSVAVSTDQGLVVPVIRDAEKLSLAQFEKQVAELGKKAQEKKLSIEEMTGGTFTISNGGVFGSLLSTPILNRPQSAILGLHKIQERAVVLGGEIEIRPMMYLALSYDHRIIDGKEAVQFLVKIKEGIEDIYHIVSEDDLS